MVNNSDAEVYSSDSKSPSASSDHGFEANEIHDTEPIDDSSLHEIPFQNLYNDTELVDNEETVDHEFDQVVDDSEDEGGEKGSVDSSKRRCVVVERILKAPDTLLESDGSNDHECQTGKQESKCDIVTGFQGSSRVTAGDCNGQGLDYLDSQEPGDATQAEALGFVDQFLMDKDLNFSPVSLPESSLRRKSPPFSGAKGRQSLAKRIKTTSPIKKMSVFDWDCEDQCDVSGPQNSPAVGANVTCFKKREDSVKDDDPCENRKVSTHSTRRSMQNDSAKDNKMEQPSGLSHDITLVSQMDAQLQDKASKEHSEPEEDFVEIGINTQIAAEAMSALLFAPCTAEEASESEMRDQVSNLSGRNNDTIEEGSAPKKKRNSKKKRKFTMKERTDTNASAVTCLLNSCEWSHPRAKRSRLTQRHHVPPRKSWGASSAKDRSETNTLSSRLRVSLSGTRQASSCQSGVNLDVANHASPRRICGKSHESSRDKDLPRSFLPKEIKRLGGSGKVDDFMWKDLRRRRNLAHVRVLFSNSLDDETIKQQKKIMGRLGISPAASSAESTHFVAEKFSRTRNMLEAIALGKPVVTPLWLESCGQTRCLLDEKNYTLKDSKKDKDGLCMLTSLARAKQRPLLKGLKVCITPNIKPDRGMIAHLVKLTQGQVVEMSEIVVVGDREFPDDLLIISCEEDRDLCLPFINQGAEIYTAELLLNGIVIQKLEYARHCLF
ncbi:BRCT domain-containing DNA repair protein [Hirschfeldia incana]|nr:BRCT domain-containing DNA repair protein [Hirschfeldia incana]